jgi:transcriptional regulator with XRE-family HTH domain
MSYVYIWLVKPLSNKFFLEIGKRLKDIREEKRISQKELAESMDILPTQYSKVENGKVVPSIQTIVKAATALNVTTDEIIFGAQKNSVKEDEIKDPQLQERIKVINALSGEDKMIALHLLDLITLKKQFKDMSKQIHILHK